jgi:F-type H+-transporting ATPase subunit delta
MADNQADTRIAAISSGDGAILAKRYAGALYDLADEQKQLDAVAADLRMLYSLHNSSAEFRYISSQPRLSRAQLFKAMQAISTSAKLNGLTANFLSLLAQNRRLSELSAMVDAFLDELATRRGEFTADVRSAKALSSVQQEKLAANLRDMAGGKVHLMLREDASLLGGLTVKLGSRLIDASVKTKLARLERQLKSQPINTQKGAA